MDSFPTRPLPSLFRNAILVKESNSPSLGMGLLIDLPFTVGGVDVLRVIQKAPCVVRLFVGDCVTSRFSLDFELELLILERGLLSTTPGVSAMG